MLLDMRCWPNIKTIKIKTTLAQRLVFAAGIGLTQNSSAIQFDIRFYKYRFFYQFVNNIVVLTSFVIRVLLRNMLDIIKHLKVPTLKSILV